MKIEVHEFDHCFCFELAAETLEEAALLVRFGINATTELRGSNAWAGAKGPIGVSIDIGKRKASTSTVPKAR